MTLHNSVLIDEHHHHACLEYAAGLSLNLKQLTLKQAQIDVNSSNITLRQE